MRRYPSTKRCEPTNRLFNALDCKTTQSPFLTLSRIGCIAFSQSNWYLHTLQNEPFSKRSHHQLPLSILPSVAKHILILIYLRVDYYVRHAFLWGRFLHEATGAWDREKWLAVSTEGPLPRMLVHCFCGK